MNEIEKRVAKLEEDKLKLEENLNLYKKTKLLHTAMAIFLIIFSSVPMIFSTIVVKYHFWAYFITGIILLSIGTLLLLKTLVMKKNWSSYLLKIKSLLPKSI
ncbi:hypothetical protein AAAQ13_10885 [Lactococcus lactis subsp. lactis]|uniref:hypothetical protein n=1 Tax=Lactococcus lactis TaxID=1358 RepID=UPI00071CE173|nr:hypothetical protein [Lactococcus lactis]KST81078.1 hypothetical protein LK231_0277 [Lactococcus lactis subsp. lactis]MBU7532434.1 hypothetical protein [Lactococcus lactis]MBU7542449.1 hypothetical protein [Lactococcus lactis]MDU0411968.1 hypothetical protein [Lactococcus lactis]WNN68545.1 hypothetical protein RIN59_00325 [Lactococcus lactis]